MEKIWLAFAVTLGAGMATAIGSCLALLVKRTHLRFLSVSMGFSAGVMLYVSFVEIVAKSADLLVAAYGEKQGSWLNLIWFFGGILLILAIDHLLPSESHPHDHHRQQQTDSGPAELLPSPHEVRLMRMGMMTAIAIGIHNFPEGLATFLAALDDPAVGMMIALAIALHNIPEGISVSIPIYYATGSRQKALGYSMLSGLAEPAGAMLAIAGISVFMDGPLEVVPPQWLGCMFAAVAGIMVYISLDGLLPASRSYGKGHDSLFGLLAGMLVMALSLVLLK